MTSLVVPLPREFENSGEEEQFPYGAFIADPTTADRSITSFFLGTEPDLADEMAFLAADEQLEVAWSCCTPERCFTTSG